jgi:hypothetical protein
VRDVVRLAVDEPGGLLLLLGRRGDELGEPRLDHVGVDPGMIVADEAGRDGVLPAARDPYHDQRGGALASAWCR